MCPAPKETRFIKFTKSGPMPEIKNAGSVHDEKITFN